MRYLITEKASNRKLGPMPVVSSHESTCPPTCPLIDGTCYAKHGPLSWAWSQMDNQFVKFGKKGYKETVSIDAVISFVGGLSRGTVWRYGQAGDLPGNGSEVDGEAFKRLVRAARGLRTIIFTHKWMSSWNRRLFRWANSLGVCVNLSADHIDQVDMLVGTGCPVAVVVPEDTTGTIVTEGGNVGRQCPATYAETNCSKCRWCSMADRDWFVYFPVHGVGASKYERDVCKLG